MDIKKILCKPAKNPTNNIDHIKFPCLVITKLDGCGMIRLPSGECFTPSGKRVANKRIEEWLSDIETEYILFGEFYCEGVKFDDISGLSRAHDREIPPNYKFYVYNAIGENQLNMYIRGDYIKHTDKIKHIKVRYPQIELFWHHVCYSYHELENIVENIPKDMEGYVVRDPRFIYKAGGATLKTGLFTKIKRQETLDCEILKCVEGKGKHSGMLGAVDVVDEQGRGLSVGSGFTEEQRKEIWDNQERYIGKVIEVIVMKKLRHPRFNKFVRIHGDKGL